MSENPPLPWAIADAAQEVVMTVDLALYSLPAVQRAAHWLTSRCFVLIEPVEAQNAVRVRLAMKDSAISRELAGEFGNRLLDEELRRQVMMETSEIRNAIVTQAFLEGDFIDSAEAMLDDDPEGIVQR